MKRIHVPILIVATLLVGALNSAAQSVKTDHDPAANFGAYKTYFWADPKPVPSNDIVSQRVLDSIDKWLVQTGWPKVSAEQADVAVAAHVSTKEQKSLDTFYSGMGGGWGYGGWGGGGMATATTSVSTYTEGTMVVDLFDAKTKKLVFRGIATDTLSSDPKKNAGKIDKSTEKMFKKNFPPGAAKK